MEGGKNAGEILVMVTRRVGGKEKWGVQCRGNVGGGVKRVEVC